MCIVLVRNDKIISAYNQYVESVHSAEDQSDTP